MTTTTRKRQMHLGLFLQGAGHHVSGWRHPDAEAGSENFDLLTRVTKMAEAAKFDMVFLADGLTSGVDAHPFGDGQGREQRRFLRVEFARVAAGDPHAAHPLQRPQLPQRLHGRRGR